MANSVLFRYIKNLKWIWNINKQSALKDARIGGGGMYYSDSTPVECELLSVKQYITLNNYLTRAQPLAQSENG